MILIYMFLVATSTSVPAMIPRNKSHPLIIGFRIEDNPKFVSI